MNRLFKTLLLWLLVAILPLHAVGAAIPMSCNPAHHQVMQKSMHNDMQHLHAMHHQQDAGTATHAHHHEAAQARDGKACHDMAAAAADSSSDSSTNNAHPHSGCSACSVGCVGAVAPPLALHANPAIGGSEAVFVSPIPLVAGYTPSSLDRPPRSILV